MPETCFTWALNAQNVHQWAFKRQNGVPRQFTCLFGAGMEFLNTSGSVDLTGSPPTSPSLFPFMVIPSIFHSPPTSIHSSPYTPPTFTIQLLFPTQSHPYSRIHLPSLTSIFFFFFFLSSFFSCSRARNILSLVW
ncbi:uncharacterized protein DS421_2g46530 [Arachis hypogaea]|nr:uncharacterized protein DS421_2g46530 [Arachis hypogaea]